MGLRFNSIAAPSINSGRSDTKRFRSLSLSKRPYLRLEIAQPSAILPRLKFCPSSHTMEVNHIRRSIEDLTERSTALRGFL